MPTLHWVGKDKVKHHHRDVPYRVLNTDYDYQAPADAPANSADNRIIRGDNLEALKSLLPEFEGKVKCIYIDPPYNTGNEGWVYNDNVKDPRIKKWLGRVVGKEGEDMSRHDKWLCMMYPRLKLLHRLLADDGVFLVSIDENEYHGLKLVLDEIFGRACYMGTIVWRTRNTDNRVKTNLSVDHEQVLAYAKKSTGSIGGRVIDRSNFKNPDDDPRGPYVTDPLTGKATAEERPNLHYEVINPLTGDVFPPDHARGWITDRQGYETLLADQRIWWPADTSGNPRKKRFLFEANERMPLSSFWADTRGQTGADELDGVLGQRLFAFPKSSDFMARLLDVACGKDALILDSFAGSGTTAHAVLRLNAQDGGNRRFILIEMMDYAETITAERVRRVMSGYGEGSKAVAGLGGGFRFQSLGAPLFDEFQYLNPAVGLAAIRDYVAYQEGIPVEARGAVDSAMHPYWLGEANGQRVFFCYEPARVTALDLDLLAELLQSPGPTLIYADQLALGEDFMRRHKLRFKKIPRDITRL